MRTTRSGLIGPMIITLFLIGVGFAAGYFVGVAEADYFVQERLRSR